MKSPSLFKSSQHSSTSGSSKTNHCSLFRPIHLEKAVVTPKIKTKTNYLWTVASFFALLMDLVEDGHDGSQLNKGQDCNSLFKGKVHTI